MRTCRSCGREHPDDRDFCTCGEYLRWEPTQHVEAVKAPPRSAAADHAGAVEITDPNVTLQPEVAAPARGPRPSHPTPVRAGPAPIGAAPGPSPGPGNAPPGVAALMLRRPEDEGASEGPVALAVEPGARATILGLIRNQSDLVDNFDVSVRGLPDGWWTVTPATAYLVPYGTAGTYEQEVQIHVHPPRSPQAQARPWSFEVVASSRAYGTEVAAAPASVEIGPYFDLATELRPERASGRLNARFMLTLRNKANARTEAALSAEDTDGECQFRFAEPSVLLEPGQAVEAPFTVFPPRQRWIGRPLDRSIQVAATPIGVELPLPPRTAVFRQRAWLPWWLSIVAPVAIALAVLIIMLLPKQTTVPDLHKAGSVFAAQKLLNQAGLKLSPQTTQKNDAKAAPGAIVDQTPKAGVRAKKDSLVSVAVAVGSNQAKVPSVVGATPGAADQALRASKLTLGAVSPQPLNPKGKIASQIPLAGQMVAGGTPVAVFLAVAGPGAAAGKGGAGKGAGGKGAAAKGAAGAAAGGGAAGAAAAAGADAILVPRVHGDPVAAAGQLSQLGLVPILVRRLSTVPVGQVAGTTPPAGSKLARGAKVTVIVSTGPPQIAYDDGRSIHVIDSVSGKPSGQVPPSASPQIEASWSADGSHLVYAQGGQLMLLRPNVQGAQPFALTQPGTRDHDPAIAPTTKALIIAFIQRGPKGAQLCFASIGRFALNPDCTSAPGWDLGGHVDWSPDGSTILVLGTRHKGANFGLLAFVSNVPFSTHASDWGHGSLQTDASSPGHGVFAGTISPDGKRMALVSNVGRDDYRLLVTRAGNFTLAQAQALPVRACQISWRSDGRKLAVMQPDGPCGPTATGTLVVVDPRNPRTPTTLATKAAHPAWQSVATGG